MRDEVFKKEKEMTALKKVFSEAETELALRNTRMINAGLIDIQKEKDLLDLEEPPEDAGTAPLSEKVDSYYAAR